MGISFNTNCKPQTSKTMKTTWIFFAIMAMIVVTNATYEYEIRYSKTRGVSLNQQRAIRDYVNDKYLLSSYVNPTFLGLQISFCKYKLYREPENCAVQNHLNTSSKFKRRHHIWRCGYAGGYDDGSNMLMHVESTDYTKMITLAHIDRFFCCWERAI